MCCFSRARTGFGGGSRLTRQGKEESQLPADVLVANGFQRRLSHVRRGPGGLAGWGAGGHTYVASTSTAAARGRGWQRC